MDISNTSLSAICEVQHAVGAAMHAAISYIQTTEKPTSEEAHRIIDSVLAQHDCESPEGHIVAGGIQSAEPHKSGTGLLVHGVPIVIDIYPRSRTTGYWADMTRTICIGTPPPELKRMYETVLAAQELAISMVKPNAACCEIQQAVEELFSDAGYTTSGKGKEFPFAEGFVHGVGHGVGREIHAPPRVGRNSTDILREGDVITIEPGLYYKHIGGVRLEDLLVVTADGYKNLTTAPKQLS